MPTDKTGKGGRAPGDGEWRRPDADDAPTGEWRRPDADDAPTGEWRRPNADDAPTGEWRRPNADDAPTGVWQPSRDAARTGRRRRPTRSTPRAREDDPTGQWRPVPDDAPTARTEVITTLPDGSIVYGSRQQPFTLARAEAVYWNMVGEAPYREAEIVHNLDTGEHIVVQGSTIDVRADAGAATAFLRDRPLGGRWSTVRHNHPIGRGRVTPPRHRYPSMADMRGARNQANLNFRPQREVLDVLTERGPLEIPFGYDQTQTEPFYVGVPEPTGGYRIERFRNVFEYEIWREQQLEGPVS
jgi:hypothetical protein